MSNVQLRVFYLINNKLKSMVTIKLFLSSFRRIDLISLDLIELKTPVMMCRHQSFRHIEYADTKICSISKLLFEGMADVDDPRTLIEVVFGLQYRTCMSD